MIKLLLPISLVLLILVGCVPVVPSTPVANDPPVAFIDSVSATTAAEGQTVTFSGHGTDLGGTVVGYSWRSDRDGVLNKSANFSTSSLTVGNHYIYFKVQDNSGDWSREVVAIINVLPIGMVKPNINSFKSTPEVIFEGQSTTLTWNVSGALSASISPDIGDIPLTGSRLISPRGNTVYTITATNKAGSVSETARITISQISGKSVELFSIAEEEGYVDRNGEVGPTPKAGVSESGVPIEAFMSFDISMIPVGATIQSVSLDLTNCIIYGYPFNLLGSMGIFPDQYSTLSARDYKISVTLDALVLTYTPPTQPYTYTPLATAVQKQVDAKNPRFRIRVQFDKYSFTVQKDERAASSGYGQMLSTPNVVEFVKSKTKLIVTYK